MTDFTRTLRCLQQDRSIASTGGLLVGLGLLATWVTWSVLARVQLHESTTLARVEAEQGMHRVQTLVGGRVTRTWLEIGREVRAGDPLLELDATPEQLQRDEAQTRLFAVHSEIGALRQQVIAEERVRELEQQATDAAIAAARAASGEAEAVARHALGEDERARQLRANHTASEQELARIHSEAERAGFAAERARAAVLHLEREQLTRAGEQTARIRRFEVGTVQLEGQANTLAAVIAQLDHAITRRMVRAPIDGRVAEAATLRVGAVLAEGEHLASLVRSGALFAVGTFPPTGALGRIAPGQRATLRLEAFPWAEYGAVALTVARVSSEVRDGTVRVEFNLEGPPPPRIPLQHGLSGTVEVEVERVSPAALILRTAGQFLGASRRPETRDETRERP